jgi:hypothetical protein
LKAVTLFDTLSRSSIAWLLKTSVSGPAWPPSDGSVNAACQVVALSCVSAPTAIGERTGPDSR